MQSRCNFLSFKGDFLHPGRLMPFRVFTLPFDPATGTFPEDDLNRFCIGKRVHSIRPSA